MISKYTDSESNPLPEIRLRRRLFEPFTTVKLMVYIRQNNVSLPFSCRLMTTLHKTVQWITVVDVVMPLRSDLLGEPTLRYYSSERYIEITESPKLRSVLKARIDYFENLLANATYDRLLEMNQKLIEENTL